MDVPTEASLKHRVPQQGRSRASFERMVETAERLMAERGTDDFTLNEVARVGKVSIGSIYGRFNSKDDLIHEVQTRVLARVDVEMLSRLDAASAAATDLATFISTTVEAVADTLKHFAASMTPFMLRANTDPFIAEIGKASYIRTAEAVRASLLSYRSAIRHPDPEHAVDAAYRMLYASLARYLGFGSSAEAAGEGDWVILKKELAYMVQAYLCYEGPTTA
ncbi:MAG: helix-turn-helix domain-containing protein [Sphingomonas sp.]